MSNSATKLRLGFAGTGWIGRHRMEAIAKNCDVEIAAIYEPDSKMAQEAAKLAPAARLAGSYAELLECDLQGVVIASPSALHAEQSIQALEKGLPVFCQKPLGRTSAEVRRVVDCARRLDRRLGVDLSYRHTEGMRQIRDLIGAGEIGDIYGVEVVFHNAYGPDKPWFYDPRLSGGGCVMDLGVHLVDLALWSLDFPEVTQVTSRLFSGGKPLEHRQQVEDYGLARIDLRSGTTVQLACSWKLPAGCEAVIEARFYGTRGGLAFKNVNGSFYDFVAERFSGTRSDRLASPPDAWGGRAAVQWAKDLAADPYYDAGADRLVDVARIIDRIYGSHAHPAGGSPPQ